MKKLRHCHPMYTANFVRPTQLRVHRGGGAAGYRGTVAMIRMTCVCRIMSANWLVFADDNLSNCRSTGLNWTVSI